MTLADIILFFGGAVSFLVALAMVDLERPYLMAMSAIPFIACSLLIIGVFA